MISPTDKKSRDELLKESRLLYQKLNRQIKEIDKAQIPLLKTASDKFKKLKSTIRYNDLSKYFDKELKNIYRDLVYIDSLKSSTLEGAIKSMGTFGQTKELLEIWSPEKQNDFWSLYSKLYKHAPDLLERYKYETFSVIGKEMLLGQDPDEILRRIEEQIVQSNLLGDNDVEVGEEFASRLELLESESFEYLWEDYLRNTSR